MYAIIGFLIGLVLAAALLLWLWPRKPSDCDACADLECLQESACDLPLVCTEPPAPCDISEVPQREKVHVGDPVLFSTGSAATDAKAVATISEIANRIGGNTKRIFIVGHADGRPISGALARQFPSNWELSAARAAAVARRLADFHDIDPSRISAEGAADFRPAATGDGEAAWSRNRRVEILVEAIASAD